MSYLVTEEKVVDGVYSCIVQVKCNQCKKTQRLVIPEAQWLAWTDGELIQCAMPQLSKADRELLISSLCGVCFDALCDDDMPRIGEDDYDAAL